MNHKRGMWPVPKETVDCRAGDTERRGEKEEEIPLVFCSYEKTASRTCHGCVDAIRASQGRLAISSYEQDTTVRSSPFWPRGGVVDFFGKGNNRAKMHLSSPSLFCTPHTHTHTDTHAHSLLYRARTHFTLLGLSPGDPGRHACTEGNGQDQGQAESL